MEKIKTSFAIDKELHKKLKLESVKLEKDMGAILEGLLKKYFEEEEKLLSKEKIINQIEKLSLSDIVHAAMEGWKNGGKARDGYAVYDPETEELESVTLGQGEEIRGDKRVYLLKVPENILGNNGYELEDWLTEEEIEDMESKCEGLVVEEYLEKYTNDSMEERLEDILLHYLEEDGLNWDSIEWQLDRR